MRTVLTFASLCALLPGCPEEVVPVDPLFPASYASTYTEVRNCRQSGDHDLNIVRVLADPIALAAYENRDEPFPIGATVVKEEYEFGDTTCEGPIQQWTVMQKLEVGSSTATLDWSWQRVDALRVVLDADERRCISCHTACGRPPDGYDGTCTIP
jgi:hypothetical protein